MMRYSRWAPPDAVDETAAHVRAHLSTVADPDDDPTAHEARVWTEPGQNPWGVDGFLVCGELDAEPDAPYLRDGFDPEQDVADNPLSVPSIRDDGGQR